MNQSIASLDIYLKNFFEHIEDIKRVLEEIEVTFAVPFTMLSKMSELIFGTDIKIAAQNVHHKTSGAYTGEISTGMLRELGVWAVIVGHSERRQYFGETDSLIAQKIQACLQANLTPIICVGETQSERENLLTEKVIERQVLAVIEGIEDIRKVIFAYEPVWAIGTGLAATADQAQEVHTFLRKKLTFKFGEKAAADCRIVYGGSMKASNTKELMEKSDIDGGLVGGASLDPKEFAEMINIAKNIKQRL